MVIAACQAAQSNKSKMKKKICEKGVETVSETGTEGGNNFEIVE